MSGYESEAALENKLIDTLVNQGYERIAINDEASLLANFREQLNKHNRKRRAPGEWADLTDKEFQKLLTHFNRGSIYNRAYNLRQQMIVEGDNGKDKFIDLINQHEWCKNEFQVTNQVTIEGHRVNRYDVTLLINGLPLVQIELKRRGVELKEAFNQINRYKSETFTGLFRFVQLFVISNGTDTKYVANNERKLNYSFAFHWTDGENKYINSLSDFAKDFLERCRLVKTITRYMVLNKTEEKLMVLRPYQIYAVERLVKLATETRNNGYIWHTTGSGKTLTSFKLASTLADILDIEKVIFLVDRRDLDEQTLNEFNKFRPGSVDMSPSTYKLVSQLADSTVNMIVTTIQKLSNAIKKERYKNVMSTFQNKRVIFIVDECHRSQFGDMHKDIKKHFDYAQYFGFTGTPIFETNANQGVATGDLFGKEVHNYLIKDGIKDRNVLGFKVDYIKPFSSNNSIPDEDIDAVDEREVLESEEYINTITDHVLNTYNRKTFNGEYNAILATDSISKAMKYYDHFKEKQNEHNLTVATIFTYNPNDESTSNEELQRDMLERSINDYNKKFGTQYSTDFYEQYFTDLSRRFKLKEIDLLIVVNMFLTGFDSVYLNTLYVDRKLQYHNLIQAFSRTNRVHTIKKQFGNIISYRTRKDDVDEAIRLYSQGESDSVLQQPYGEVLAKLNKSIQQLKVLAPQPETIDSIESENAKEDFVFRFREVLRLDTKLRNFLEYDMSNEDVHITEREFADYKSKYLGVKKETEEKTEKVSVLNDIDFNIELLETDKINVDYILKLLANIDYSNYIKKQTDIDKIRKMLEENYVPGHKSKIELLQNFIDKVIPTLTNESNVEEEFLGFIEQERSKKINHLQTISGLSGQEINDFITEFQFTGIHPDKKMRQLIKKNVESLSELRKVKNKIKNTIEQITESY